MTRLRLFHAITLFLLAVNVFSCIPTHPNIPKELELSFIELVPIEDMNKYFQVYVDPSDQNNLQLGSDIMVRVKNISNQQIIFPADLGFKLLIVNSPNWIEAENKNEYYSLEPLLILKGRQETGNSISTFVRPRTSSKIVENMTTLILRIVAIGELYSHGKGTGIHVGAYTDVYIKP